MSARPPVGPATVLGVGLAALAVGSTAVSFSGLLVLQRSQTSLDLPAVHAVDVDTSTGSVEVVADSSGATSVERRESWTFSRAERSEQVVDGVLRLRARCTGWFATCEIAYVVHVARGTTVTARTSSGDITARGTGAVQARADSGDVSAVDTVGDLDLRTGSGDVRTTRAAAGRVTGRTASGDLDAALASSPGTLDLSTGSGDLSVRLPDDGSTAYAVSAGTGSGTEDVRVRTDPASRSTLSARTGSGDLSVGYLPGP